MQRASYHNQARVHNGYHYPRSMLTALRSHVLFPRFCKEFSDCIEDGFEHYYMIGQLLGKVTAKQFKQFCQRIGAPCEPAPQHITQLVNSHMVEAVFTVQEYAFDAEKLKTVMQQRCEERKVEFRLKTMIRSVKEISSGGIEVEIGNAEGEKETLKVEQVFNCTYSMVNQLLHASNLPLIPLQHEMTEMCLVEMPDTLQQVGITVMCGPFFSTMPFPVQGLHSFSHVRYTPHYHWHDKPDMPYRDAHHHCEQVTLSTAWPAMIADAKRYIPALKECEYKDSLWEVKTTLPRSAMDDSRPILFKQDYGIKGLHCIIGGKIDNIYDMIEIIRKSGLDR